MFENIENNIAVEKIRHKGISIWPIVKSYAIEYSDDVKVVKRATSSTLKILLKNLLGDLFSMARLKRSPYWVFTNSERRYHIDKNSFDRVTTGLQRYIGSYLLFENPIPKGRTQASKLHPREHYIGMSWIFLLQFLVMKLTKKPKIEGLDELNYLFDKDMSNIKRIYHRIVAGSKVYEMLIRLFKPKAIFVVCYYSQFELISAAKKHNIPVIELQHGLITRGHRAYYFKKEQPQKFMPDYFLSYGPYFSQIILEGKLVGSDSILDYGYSFLDEVDSQLEISTELIGLKKQFDLLVCVTGQLEVTDIDLMKMVLEVSKKFPKICFLFKPRFSHSFPQFVGTDNLKRVDDINTYELLKFCDCHLTVYSTCALESIALGTPNISVDIKGYYSKYLKDLLYDNSYNFVADCLEDLESILLSFKSMDDEKEEIKASMSRIFSPMVTTKTFLGFFQKIVDQKPSH